MVAMFEGATFYNHTLCGAFITSTAEKTNMFLNAGSNAKIATKHCCGIGKYTSSLVPNTCKPCGVGKYQDEPSTGAPCKLCKAGQYSTAGKAQLSNTVCHNKCPPGTWNTGIENTSACTDLCTPGKWSNEEGLSADSECKNCRPGTWSTGLGNTSACTDLCSPGKWSNEEGLSADSECKLCSAGKWSSDTGITSDTNCTSCDKGRFSTAGEGQTSSTVCDNKCAAGTYSNEEAISSESQCKACLKGQSTNNEKGSVSCSTCLDGFYQPSKQQPSCIQCPIGRVFKEYCGARNPGLHDDLDDCTPCVRATYQNELGKIECKCVVI